EFLPGFEASNWFGVAAPRNTPPEIIDKLNKEINVALAEPAIKARLARLGGGAAGGLARRFRKLHRGRSREVEQGDPNGQYQSRLTVCRLRRRRKSRNEVWQLRDLEQDLRQAVGHVDHDVMAARHLVDAPA